GVAGDPRPQVRVTRGVGHLEVAGQQVEEGGDVGGALDARVPAQRHDPAAGAPDVAEQQLDDRPRPDVLGAHAVLRPADAVDEVAGAFAGRGGHPGVGDGTELLRRDPGDLGDQLGGVARVVPLEDLVD